MKIIYLFFILFLFISINSQSQFCFEQIHTDRIGTFSLGSNTCNGYERIYLVRPTGNVNLIRFSFSQLQICGTEMFDIYGFNPETNEIIDPYYDFTFIDPGNYYDNYYVEGKAFIIVFYNEYLENSTTNFTINYEVIDNYVTPETFNYTSLSGSFEDGSGLANYDNNIIKRYIIKPTGANLVELVFTDFKLGLGDDVKIFNGENEFANLIAEFQSDKLPTYKIVSNADDLSEGNTLCVLFTTNISNTAPGWNLEYRGINNNVYKSSFYYNNCGTLKERVIELRTLKSVSSVKRKKRHPLPQSPKFSENIGSVAIEIYPNPTQGELKVDLSGFDLSSKNAIYIVNTLGKLVKQVTPIGVSNIIDLTGLPNGTYIMRIIIGDRSSEWKIIKE
jgi:hypothetical protein